MPSLVAEEPYERAVIATWIWLDAEVDRLRARVALLEGVLREVEWIEAMDGLIYCESCKRERTYGHMPDCELAAALNWIERLGEVSDGAATTD